MPNSNHRRTKQHDWLQPFPNASTNLSADLRQLHQRLDLTRLQYLNSGLAQSIESQLRSKRHLAVTRIVSLGLGDFKSTSQSRRLKQLSILLAIAGHFQHRGTDVEIFAQDPSFTKSDEAFLKSLGVQILHTPSSSELGQASDFIDESTLVYSPFLTLEAYNLLFSTKSISFFIGDDFDALRQKWPKKSAAHNEVESVYKHVRPFQKRVMGSNAGFWESEDHAFPMAMYWNPSRPIRSLPNKR